ncbi:hypothetical protein [Listeria sp. PSOL-1]|uniref:hypothetical protein n=1 Tax=Listeria sp. PSOL-1 TaxID=1844999 RepID=UPI0013D0C113|nr:hypothetical protein [Listeria sp. PSOL-1]
MEEIVCSIRAAGSAASDRKMLCEMAYEALGIYFEILKKSTNQEIQQLLLLDKWLYVYYDEVYHIYIKLLVIIGALEAYGKVTQTRERKIK